VDVTDEGQVHAAVDAAVARFGRIDVVVNNAGRGLLGAVEEATDAAARAVFDTKVFVSSTSNGPYSRSARAEMLQDSADRASVARDASAHGAIGLDDLDQAMIKRGRKDVAPLLCSLVTMTQGAVAGRETERVNDVWDLAVCTVGASARVVSRGN
jgi:NAD(P)-dependent dehydrogenase (short-subunit alcohol dehydrogenase family)